MDPRDLAILLDEILDDEILTTLESSFSGAVKFALDSILSRLNGLKLDKSGNIKPTVSNLKEVQRIKADLKQLVFNSQYEEGVEAIKSGFEKSIGEIDNYLSQTFAGFEPNQRMRNLVELSIEAVTTQIGANGYGVIVTNRISDALNQAVTAGIPLRDLVSQMTDDLVSEALLQVSRFNIKQIVTDALGALSRRYLKIGADRLGLKWYVYRGGKIKTTRDFCRVRDGGYYHDEEIEEWSRLDWDGKMEGTNSVTIFDNLGGYNCRHRLIPVHESEVPEQYKTRLGEIRAGNLELKSN